MPRKNLRAFNDWGVLLVVGMILVILGFIAVTLPQLSAFAMFKVIGWILFLSGLFQICQLIGANVTMWERLGSMLVLALLYGLIGLFLIINPYEATHFISTILGLFFFIAGLIKLFGAFRLYPARYWHWLLLTGFTGILFAIYLFAMSSAVKTELLSYLVGFYLLLHGISMVFYASALRGLTR